MDETVWSAYLRRIAVPRPLTADTVTLHVLHRAHQLTVPFENLSIHLAEPITLGGEALIDKIVHRGRGGICYELNGAFALLLESLDAQVTRVAARVYGADGRLGIPFDHMALIVRSSEGSGPWLADIGFGRNSVYPLLFDSRAEQDAPGGRFLLADTDDGDVDLLRDGQPQYRIERRERAQSDFAPTCWWQQSSPDSHFTHATICSASPRPAASPSATAPSSSPTTAPAPSSTSPPTKPSWPPTATTSASPSTASPRSSSRPRPKRPPQPLR